MTSGAQKFAVECKSSFGWNDDLPTQAHEYLLPIVVRHVARTTKAVGRRLRILDVGCGNGFVAAQLAQLGHDVTGFDADEQGVAIAEARNSAARFYAGSLYDEGTENANGPFDMVIALEVIEHLFQPGQLFNKTRGMMNPGGVLLVSTPYHGYLKNLALSLVGGWDRHFQVHADGGHIKFFSKDTLAKLAVTSGFQHPEFTGAGRMPLVWKSIVMRAVRG